MVTSEDWRWWYGCEEHSFRENIMDLAYFMVLFVWGCWGIFAIVIPMFVFDGIWEPYLMIFSFSYIPVYIYVRNKLEE